MTTPKDKLAKLVNSFRIADYRLMSEATTRLSYIDRFWEALGWTISDVSQVMVEQTDDRQKRPDYRFIVNGKTQFFVEAKKPAEKLINPRHIYQTKLYCWNGNVPLAILTDFEEFRPFHSIGQPTIEEAKKGLLNQFDMTFEQYPDRADELLNAFGREAVLAGSLQELLKTPPKMLRDSVDKAFLRSLSDWRKIIADNIARNNKFNSEFELSEAVQRILDRIVFLRVLNDRDIEDKDQLELILSKGNDFYTHFVELCRSYAPKYNGLIFNSHQVSEELEIDDYVFQPILKEFSYDNSPYRFDEIPVEMLGTIYEQFLGDEVTLENGRAVIEQKPEVRKAGGVYYTPQYIVEYIVDNTVGKLLENCKTPNDVSKLKICDPACGSGSFLLGAFDKLIKWHEKYYTDNPEKAYDTIGKSKYLLAYQDGKDNNSPVRLTARMKGQILKNNLYGVDLDRQATEVAQMSLYIKCLEGLSKEPTFTLGFMEAILPKLDGNIKCGNSLIGSDFMHEDFFGLSEKERRKINPFDWEEKFPFLKETGGFDAVIGNPPYVQPVILDAKSQRYFFHNFVANSDLYSMFIEKCSSILKENNVLGFIVPSLFIKGVRYENLRNLINKNYKSLIIREYGDGVFENVQMPTCIIFMLKGNIIDKNHFVNSNQLLFTKKNVTQLGSISVIRRGLEIGRDKFSLYDKIVCLNGGCIDKYEIKNNLYISETTLQTFNKDKNIFKSPKILVRETGNKFFSTIDYNNAITNRSIYNVKLQGCEYKIPFILGIINSRLFQFYFKQFIAPDTNIFPKIRIAQLNDVPIIKVDVNNQYEKAQHDKMVELVERMLKLNKDKQTADEFTRKQIEQYIARTDKEIDALVYELYGLTEEEIKIVEGK